ncbi:DUF2255 family protein [Streptomyces spinosus]|uniref:DUF2255 family protein n=1 Tax=Streptomyces spinosus TaxID=2872623 RepID=UPI001CEDF65C|nr:DUF2255 family protein [Streptomyces spinosus]
MTAWTPEDQDLLAETYALTLTAGDDGQGEGVEIGMVVVDGDLYVRAYRGVRSRWYQAARDHGHGRIRVAGVTRDVCFRTRDLELSPGLEAAFRAKYGALADALVASPEARAATIRIDPAPVPDPGPAR